MVELNESSRWRKDVEEKKVRQPEHSYLVCLEDGSLLWRNKCHLHPRLEPIMIKSVLTPTYPSTARYFNQYPEKEMYPNGATIDGDFIMPVPGCSSARMYSRKQ